MGRAPRLARQAQGVTVSVADLVVVPVVAEMTGICWDVTVAVLTTKVTELEPAGTVTVAGTVAAAVRLLCKLTIVPPEGALPVSVTVAVLVCTPP